MNRSKVVIIAEAGVNHNGDLDMAFKLVDEAASAGADIVKFQSFRADKLASKNAPKANYQIENDGSEESQYDMLKRLELSESDHYELIEHCKKRNIEFLSTPFDVDGLHMLVDQFNISTIKLGSSELTNAPILLAAAQTGHPVIISTGMATIDDIQGALGVLAFGYLNIGGKPSHSAFEYAFKNVRANKVLSDNVTILHCTTAYPTPHHDANLNAMHSIKDKFDIPVGYSDHTMGIEVPIAAVAMGATIIEKHFTLDRSFSGPDHKASLEPSELIDMVRSIRNVESALGNGHKVPAKSEQTNMFMARKSVVAANDIQEGELLTPENLAIKRPASGCSPMNYWDVIGTKATRSYKKDDSLDS